MPPSEQNDHFPVPSAGPAASAPTAPNGGSSRVCQRTADHAPRSTRAETQTRQAQQVTARTVPGPRSTPPGPHNACGAMYLTAAIGDVHPQAQRCINMRPACRTSKQLTTPSALDNCAQSRRYLRGRCCGQAILWCRSRTDVRCVLRLRAGRRRALTGNSGRPASVRPCCRVRFPPVGAGWPGGDGRGAPDQCQVRLRTWCPGRDFRVVCLAAQDVWVPVPS
jgi:hypothetical protein